MSDNIKLRNNTYVFTKAFYFLLFFLVFHMGYDITKWQFLKPFFGVNESVFQHLKMAFWAYVSLSITEFFVVRKKKLYDLSQFFYSRIFSAVFLPWVIFVLWYLVPAVHGKIHNFAGDLLWALFVTYISGVFVIGLEKEIEYVKFSVLAKITLIVMVVSLTFLFIFCTYRLPWLDLFAVPK